MTGGSEGRRESQEQNEVDHGDFEMVVRTKKTVLLNQTSELLNPIG